MTNRTCTKHNNDDFVCRLVLCALELCSRLKSLIFVKISLIFFDEFVMEDLPDDMCEGTKFFMGLFCPSVDDKFAFFIL